MTLYGTKRYAAELVDLETVEAGYDLRQSAVVIKTGQEHYAALREQGRQRAEQEQRERAEQAAQSRAVLASLHEQAPAQSDGQAACASCGQAVTLWRTPRAEVFTVPVFRPRGPLGDNLSHVGSVRLARCPECRSLRDRAAGLTPSGGIMRERAEAALCALAVLGKPLPSTSREFAPLLRGLWQAGQAVRWQGAAPDAAEVRSGQGVVSEAVQPSPWAHVTDEDRAMLRRACSAILAERMAATRPPLRVEPPEGPGLLRGCLVCGVGHVEVPAVKAARTGGNKAVAAETWHRYSMALPSPKGLRRREGHVCPACKAAQNREGGNGPGSRVRALLDYLTAAGRTDEAGELRRALTVDEVAVTVRLPAWCATGRVRPSETPWEHLGRLDFEVKFDS